MAKKKELELYVGNCLYCNKSLYSNMGGWIASPKFTPTRVMRYFCHNGKEGSCFDRYSSFTYQLQLNAEMAHVSTLDTNWEDKPPYKQMIENFFKEGKINR